MRRLSDGLDGAAFTRARSRAYSMASDALSVVPARARFACVPHTHNFSLYLLGTVDSDWQGWWGRTHHKEGERGLRPGARAAPLLHPRFAPPQPLAGPERVPHPPLTLLPAAPRVSRATRAINCSMDAACAGLSCVSQERQSEHAITLIQTHHTPAAAQSPFVPSPPPRCGRWRRPPRGRTRWRALIVKGLETYITARAGMDSTHAGAAAAVTAPGEEHCALRRQARTPARASPQQAVRQAGGAVVVGLLSRRTSDAGRSTSELRVVVAPQTPRVPLRSCPQARCGSTRPRGC